MLDSVGFIVGLLFLSLGAGLIYDSFSETSGISSALLVIGAGLLTAGVLTLVLISVSGWRRFSERAALLDDLRMENERK